MGNIHHYLVGAQGALPVDSVGNPWSGSYVYNSGNLVLDLLYNLMLESTGRLQKCRIYEMTDNKTARSTIAYLIVRDQAHEIAFAKALETLGVDWEKTLPIPKTNADGSPRSRSCSTSGCRTSSTASTSTTCPRPARSSRASRPRVTGPCWWRDEQMPQGVPMTTPPSGWRNSPGPDKDLLARSRPCRDGDGRR